VNAKRVGSRLQSNGPVAPNSRSSMSVQGESGSHALAPSWTREELATDGAIDALMFRGRGLHTGTECGLVLRRCAGPLTWFVNAETCTLDGCEVVATKLGVVLGTPLGQRLHVVEHLLSALAGLGIHEGLHIESEGPEVPLLDGASRAFAQALRQLFVPDFTQNAPVRLEVVREAQLEHGDTRYRFVPGEAPRVDVEVEFTRGAIGKQRASWNGGRSEYVEHIAGARTFGFSQDAPELARQGLARGADPRSVLVLGDDGAALWPSAPMQPGELARHKLLDLAGDAFWYGGVPRGTLSAWRPGHTATHAVFQRALSEGILLRRAAPL